MAVNGIVGAKHLLTRMGTPYEVRDCINAVVTDVIRSCPGGKKDYRIGGCTALWKSHWASGKYRDITEILTIADCECQGFLVGDILAIYDAETQTCEHVGYYMGGIGGYEAVHSSKTKGCLCGTTVHNGFTHVLRHRYITGVVVGSEDVSETTPDVVCKMKVKLNSGHLNLRKSPSTKGDVIGEIPDGAVVDVYETGEWARVRYDGMDGYVYSAYLTEYEDEAVDDSPQEESSNVKWGVFLPCASKEEAEALADRYTYRLVCQMEVND